MSLDIYRGITYIISSKFGTILLTFIINPLLIRLLGAEYGNFTFIMSMLAIGALVLNGAVYDGIRKFIAEGSDREGWKSEVFGYYVRVATFATAAVIVLILVAVETGFTDRFLDEDFDLYFYLLALMLLAREFFIISRSTLMGFGSEHISETLYTLQRLLFGIFGVGMAVLGFGVAGVLIGDVVATTIVMVAGFAFISRRVRLRQIFTRTPESFPGRKLLGYNSMSVVLSLLFNSLYHVDILLLRPLTGAQSTAYYKGALLVAEFLWVVPIAIQNALVHVSSSMWAEEQYDGIDHLASRITRYTLLFHVLLVMGLAVLAEPFVRLYFGQDFVAAVGPLYILLPGALGYALTRPLIGIGKGKGDLRVLVYATVVSATANLVLNLILIPRYGMYGAAVATTVGYGSMLGTHLWAARRIGYDPLGDLRLGRLAATAGVTLPVIYGLDLVIRNDVLALVVVPPIGFAVYTVAAISSGALTRAEIDHILERIPVPIPSRVRDLFGA